MLQTKQQPICVSDVNTTIKLILENDPLLTDIWIQGELTNVKFYAKGNQLYFNLSDGKATLNCVIYSQFLRLLTFEPQNGLAVFARGKIKVFQNKGTYIFQVVYLSLDGVGKHSQQFDALKKQLHSEGLFHADTKTPLPIYPRSIGVITSPDSAAMWDFINTVRSSVGYCSISIIPAIMQGNQAPFSIIDALNLSEQHSFDLIVLIRGGGSQEDLSCFNDELLVRRLFKHETPVVCGIGHDIDITLTDFVVDKTCSTPTAVGQLITANFNQLYDRLMLSLNTLHHLIDRQIQHCHHQLISHLNSGIYHLDQQRNQCIDRYSFLAKQLTYSNPLHQLEKGFCLVKDTFTGKPLTSIQNVQVNDKLQIQLQDGIIDVLVEEKYDKPIK